VLAAAAVVAAAVGDAWAAGLAAPVVVVVVLVEAPVVVVLLVVEVVGVDDEPPQAASSTAMAGALRPRAAARIRTSRRLNRPLAACRRSASNRDSDMVTSSSADGRATRPERSACRVEDQLARVPVPTSTGSASSTEPQGPVPRG
jgi:hypothetical protein